MGTITIPQEEYEELKKSAVILRKIEKTIHEDFNIAKLQEKQHTFDFLREEPEIYERRDVKCKKVQ